MFSLSQQNINSFTIALLGDSCAASADECVTEVPNSECDANEKCKCSDGFVQDSIIKDECFEGKLQNEASKNILLNILFIQLKIKVKTDLGGSCSIEEQCALEFATCAGEEENFKCMTVPGRICARTRRSKRSRKN